MGIGDWGLGVGDLVAGCWGGEWGGGAGRLRPTPNPQPPNPKPQIPNPQSPIPIPMKDNKF